jgi:hypothetical protein
MADEKSVDGWPREHIPDDSSLFMRAHRQHIADGELGNGVFPRRVDGLSADWNKYSTPQETRERARNSPPHDNAVISLSIGEIRKIPSLAVEHDPDNDPEWPNRAHSLIKGLPTAPDLTRVRFKLRQTAHFVIRLD